MPPAKPCEIGRLNLGIVDAVESALPRSVELALEAAICGISSAPGIDPEVSIFTLLPELD
jgi:hypothetical protein